MDKVKIVFIHNTIMPYREPFFQKLQEFFTIKYVFNDVGVSQEKYFRSIDISSKNYSVKNSYFGLSPSTIIKLLREKPDIIVDSFLPINAFFSFFVAKILKKPIIFWSESWDWPRKSNFRYYIMSNIHRFFMVRADAILVPGVKHKDYFLKMGVTHKNVFIMPNVSNFLFGQQNEGEISKIKNDLELINKKVILYVGRLIKRKGVHYLIRSFGIIREKHPDVLLIIIGRGPCENQLKKLVDKLGLTENIIFLHNISDKQLANYYTLCNFCVIPSFICGIGDPWVFVVNEAMTYGKPVIATDAVGAAFSMIIDGTTGFIVPEKNIKALAEKMDTILSDPQLEYQMGIESRKVIEENYTYDKMVDGFISAINYVNDLK